MIDFHCHILPGIDDGAQNLEESIALARQSVADGVSHIVTTPHGSGRGLEVQLGRRDTALELLRGRLAEEKLNLILIPGLEYFADSNLTESGVNVPRCRCGEEHSTGIRPLLFELSMDMDIGLLESILFSAQLHNLPLVLAHPERYRGFTDRVDYFASLQDRGMYLQFNSVDFHRSFFHRSIPRTMLTLIKHDPHRCLIGSDAHHSEYRPAGLAIARKCICHEIGDDAWNLMSEITPRKLLGL